MMDKEVIKVITGVKEDVLQAILNMGQELRSEMAEMKQELRSEMAEMKQELRSEMAEMKQELKAEIDEVKQEVEGVKNRVKKIELTQENVIIPLLNEVTDCYTTTFERYKVSVDEHEQMKQDIALLNTVVEEHSDILQRIS